MQKRLAIIPARGGSKRILRKNIKAFLGKPIIAYSIQAALDSGCFDEVMVSTEDEEIADVAMKYGATFPFKRTTEMADDFSTTTDVLLEVLQSYLDRGDRYLQACCIYPTAPLMTVGSLLSGLSILEKPGVSSVIPVTPYPASIWRAFGIEDNKLSRLWPENENVRSQDLPVPYIDAGQFYWFDTTTFLKERTLLNDNTRPLVIPNSHVQDIDTIEDWRLAEEKYTHLYTHHSTQQEDKFVL